MTNYVHPRMKQDLEWPLTTRLVRVPLIPTGVGARHLQL